MATTVRTMCPMNSDDARVARGRVAARDVGRGARRRPADADPEPLLWMSPRDASARGIDDRAPIRMWTEMAKGGHFAAFEQPELFVQDVRAYFRTLR